MRLFRNFAVVGLSVVLSFASASFAGTINGTVVNKTDGKPAAGDKVTLLSLMGALDEVASTKTDGQGHFKLTTPSDAPYLIKVEHEKGNYFKNVPPGTTQVAINVYDVASKVDGVSTEADVMRLEAANGQLTVTENYFVRNTSSPPRTQAGERTFEVVLPLNAVLDGARTVDTSRMPLAATPDPVGAKGHYAFSFPIRPNEGENGTQFQLTYHLPYTGSAKFSPQLTAPADNVAVLLPKSMKFEPGPGTGYQAIMDDPSAQTFLMRNVSPGTSLAFAVTGEGQMPRDDQGGGQAGPASGAGGQDAAATQSGPGGTPGGGLGNPINTPDPLDKYKWWILGGVALLMAAGAAVLLRRPGGSTAIQDPVVAQALAMSSAAPQTKSQQLLEALKEELFAIESEKVAGRLSATEYAELKAALETVLRRALARS